MILRVPDYFEEFSCIADKCKDSCCIGWEIDIDEDTHDYYMEQSGDLKKKFDKYMYVTKEGDYSFDLVEHGRCPFLDDRNLCEICIALGEEALSEVCTEYPRFAIEYGNVLQKILSLSCEEVGRILFEKKDVVRLVDRDFGLEEEVEEEDQEFITFLEEVQKKGMDILQNRNKGLSLRVNQFLRYMAYISDILSDEEADLVDSFDENEITQENVSTYFDFEDFISRFETFEKMEVLGDEWRMKKEELSMFYSKDTYESWMKEYLLSYDYKEEYYEKLLVYFINRYFMNSVYDCDVLSYGKLAVVFTLVIRDMDALKYKRNKNRFTIQDMIDDARIFSKEVEHSEENVELAREDFLFEEVFQLERIIEQF